MSDTVKVRRTWKKRLLRAGLIAIAVIVVFRVTLIILLPTVISRTARSLGLDCDYSRMKLSIIGTNVSLWDVVISSKDGTQQVLKADYATANLSTLQLFRLRLVAFRLEAEGVDVTVQRKADGSLPLLTLLAPYLTPRTAPANAKPPAPKAPDFSSPLEMHALRLFKLAVHIKDETLNPPFEDTVRMDLRVTNLGRKNHPVRLEFDASSRDLFSSAAVTADATLASSSLAADLELSLRGLRTDHLAPYLSPLGLHAQNRNIDLHGVGKVSLAASTSTIGALEGSASLSDLNVTADYEPVASLKFVSLDIASASPSSVHLSKVKIDGGTLNAERTVKGDLRFAAFVPATETTRAPIVPAPSSAPAPPPVSAPVAASAGSPFQWRIDTISASNLAAVFDDRALFPVRRLSFELTSATVKDLRSDGPPELTPTLDATMTAPGIIGSIHATASAKPFQAEPKTRLQIDISSIRPDAFKPYFEARGGESTFESGSMQIVIDGVTSRGNDGRWRTNVTFDRIALQDRGATLFEVGPVKFTGLAQDATGAFEIASIEGSGPAISARRLQDGRLEFLGLRIGPEPEHPAVPVPPLLPALISLIKPPEFYIPPLRLDALAWSGIKLSFEDLSEFGSAPFEFTDGGIELKNIIVAPPGAPPAAPGSVHARFTCPGLLDSLDISGTLATATRSVETELTVKGNDITLTRFAPYLKPQGIEPTLNQGSLTAHLRAGVSKIDKTTRASASATDIAFTSSQTSLLSLASAGVDRVDFAPGGIAIGRASVSNFELTASRDATGINVLGLKLLPQAPAAAPTDLQLIDPFQLLTALGRISIDSVAVENTKISWSDSAAKSPISTALTLNASLTKFALVSAGTCDTPAAPFEVHLQAPGIAQDLQVRGTLSAAHDAVRLMADVVGHGLSTATAAAYLPPGIESALDDGELAVNVGFAMNRVAPSSLAANLTVRDFDYRAKGAPEALAHADSFDFDIVSLTPATHDLHINKISAQGVTAAATGRPDGSIALLGLALTTPPPLAAPPTSAAPSTAAQPAVTLAPSKAPDIHRLVATTQQALPLIEVDAIDINLSCLSFTGPEPAAPIAIADTHLRAAEPFRLLGATADTNPPAKFTLTGKVEPLIGAFDVAANTAPFAAEPSLSVALSASGIDASRLTQVVPDFAPFIDGSKLTDGRFCSTISATAKVQRRGPVAIDWSRSAAFTLSIDRTEFRASEGGPLLAGVEKIHADAARFDPATGNITIPNLEIENIAGNAWHDEAGVHIFGLIVKPPAAAPAETSTAAAAPEAPPATHTASAASPGDPAANPASPSRPEIRIDRLSTTGLDFKFEDRTVQPPLTIPFNALDAEVRGLSSLILERDRPVRFNITAGAGKVSLPRNGRKGSEDTSEVEDRDFFTQFTAAGALAFYPQPRGRAIIVISGVELAALRGIAHDVGASLGGGVFDARVNLAARDDGAVNTRAKLVVTDLRYSEPAGGPVERYMVLPVPVDAAITIVETPDGSITIPIDLTLDKRGLTTGKLMSAAAVAAGKVVGTAVLTSPVHLAAGVGNLIGDPKAEAQWTDEAPIYVDYPAGLTTLSPKSVEALNAVLARARSWSNIQVTIQHELGVADAALTTLRANPAAVESALLVAELRRRRESLLAERATLVPLASAWALGVEKDPAARDRLRTLNHELADLEDSVDQLYALQTTGADSLKTRRSRAAALELIDARLADVRRTIDQVAGPDGAARVTLVGGRPIVGDSEASRLVIRVRQKK